MYKVVLPILGFENVETLEIEKLDDLMSFLILGEKTKMSVVNIDGLSKVSFDFQIDEDVLEKLKNWHIKKISNFRARNNASSRAPLKMQSFKQKMSKTRCEQKMLTQHRIDM